MATITASVSISSDIMSYRTSINKTMTMTKAASCNGLEETSGLNSKKVQSTTRFLLFPNADATTLKASKVYIRNTGSDKASSFTIGFGEDLGAATIETIGKLHGGDWMLIPYLGDVNITVASSTTDTQYLEYMVFAETMLS